MTTTDNARVDDAGNVYVTDSTGERLIGQYADVSPEEALAFFVRKFNDTNASLVLIEQRAKNGAAASEIAESASKISEQIAARAGIGNYDALSARLEALQASLEGLSEAEKARRAEATEKALAERTLIVEAIEKLAASDPASLRWKDVSSQIDALFTQWQEAQKSGPRLSKKDGDSLWKRFRDARNKLDHERRAYFAELDQRTKSSKSVKEELIAAAEKLSGDNSLSQYRDLLEKWKKAPRAGKKVDDALWARFKAAGDALYQAKKAADDEEDASYSGNLEVKLAILDEAELLLTATDAESARATLKSLNKRWDVAGKVPRAQLKSTEERMRKVEAAVRKLEDAKWNASDPEKIARSNGLAGQIESKIADLTAERDAAQKAGNAAAVKKLEADIETQKSWLSVL
jgi:hypothetical protein